MKLQKWKVDGYFYKEKYEKETLVTFKNFILFFQCFHPKLNKEVYRFKYEYSFK